MKHLIKLGFLLLGMIVLTTNLFAQKEWKTAKTKDGMTVKSNISKRTNEKGNEVQLIEYTATATANASLAKCISTLKDVSKHKIIIDEKLSEKVKTISDNECLVYYFFSAPWPLPNSDCVANMVLSEDAIAKTATFTLTAAPTMFEKKKVERMTYYNIIYAFKDLGNGRVEMTTSAKISPLVQVPDWMIGGFFPDGPADVLRRIIKLTTNI